MDVEKVYLGANRSSAGRRVPFYARAALPPMTLCHGQLSQSWALSEEVLTGLMRMWGEEEDVGSGRAARKEAKWGVKGVKSRVKGVKGARGRHEKHSTISQSGIVRASPTLFPGWNIVRTG